MVKRGSGRPRLVVTADGTGVAAHVGSRLLADMGDALGLTAVLSAAMAPTRRRRSAHDPGRVLVEANAQVTHVISLTAQAARQMVVGLLDALDIAEPDGAGGGWWERR